VRLPEITGLASPLVWGFSRRDLPCLGTRQEGDCFDARTTCDRLRVRKMMMRCMTFLSCCCLVHRITSAGAPPTEKFTSACRRVTRESECRDKRRGEQILPLHDSSLTLVCLTVASSRPLGPHSGVHRGGYTGVSMVNSGISGPSKQTTTSIKTAGDGVHVLVPSVNAMPPLQPCLAWPVRHG
jgi:hypothetical protein